MARYAVTLIFIAAAALSAGGSPASAVDPDWEHASRVTVDLSSFKFSPAVVQLRAGQPVVLHLANVGSGGHDFTARDFFAAAAVRPEDAGKVRKGSIEVGGHESVDVALMPKAGRYPLRCGHAFHSTFGMKGSIVVR